MELELKHITPYLPYRLKGVVNGWVLLVSGIDKPYTLSEVIIKFLNEKSDEPIQNFKPILKPLSDLRDNKDFIRKFGGDNPNNLRMCNLDIDDLINNGLEFETYYGYYEWLIENHFDVFRLIENNLAIDINTLNK
jgi:hypothetical protein